MRWLALLALVLSASCTAHVTRVELPACAERFDVVGEHTRIGARALLLDHSFDVPGARTEILLDDEAPVSIVSSRPDATRAAAGGVVALGGAALASAFLLRRAAGVQENSAGAVAVGSGAFLVGGALVLTGWHPPGDVDLRDRCPEEERP